MPLDFAGNEAGPGATKAPAQPAQTPAQGAPLLDVSARGLLMWAVIGGFVLYLAMRE